MGVSSQKKMSAGSEIVAEPAKTFDDLPDETIEICCAWLADDYCAGVTSLVRLAQCCKRTRRLVHDPACIERCAAQYGLSVERPPNLEILAIAETMAGLGTNRIFFQRKGRAYMHSAPVLRPGSSMARLVEFALLLRRHPRLSLRIEGHEGSHEGVCHDAEDGSGSFRASFGQSVQRADAVRNGLLELECLEKLTKLGAKQWGRLPAKRFASRIQTQGWEDSVAEAAGWSGGLETCHAECFFTLDGIEVPARPPHYSAAAAVREAHVGWQRHFAAAGE